jgi:AraC-like DNA-binding protein
LAKNIELNIKTQNPSRTISDFVESFWMLSNQSGEHKEVVVLPDGRIDLFLTKSENTPFSIKLLGLGQSPVQTTIPPNCVIYSISFNPISVEYLFKKSISSIINQAEKLESSFWNFAETDIDSFEEFCVKANSEIHSRLPVSIDQRKVRLFELIYSSKGAMAVDEMSKSVAWSSRQINRYFNSRFGISLKAYCSIIRFRSSFNHLKKGKLFPEESFSDQPHFIKEVKKLSGFNPKVLAENKNDRFIQFSAIPRK